MGSVHFVDLFKFFTLVESVHVVDWGLDPPWGPSTLWTYLSFLPLLGPSTLWTGVLTLDGVCPLCGHICFLPLLGPSTLWTGVLILDGIRPLCGLIYVFDPCWGPSTLWSVVFDPLWGPSTLWTCLNFRPSSLCPSTDSSNLLVVIIHSIVWMFFHKI